MKFNPWTPALAGLLLVAGVQTLESAPTGDPVADIRASFKEAKRDKTLDSEMAMGWVDQLFVLAEEGAGADQGFDSLMLILEVGKRFREPKAAAEYVPDMIIESYASDFEKIAEFLDRVKLDDGQLATLTATTTSDQVKATCLVMDVQAALRNAGYAKIPEEKANRALAACEKLSTVYGDLKNSNGAPFRDAVEGDYFQLQNLRIGMVAPDIVANDLDGVEFKLSDYRGKVVVLDFWGNW